LTNIYVKAQFSPDALDADDQEQTLAIWQRIRRQIVIALGLFWLKKFNRSNKPGTISENLE
jgi:hypothetical protein